MNGADLTRKTCLKSGLTVSVREAVNLERIIIMPDLQNVKQVFAFLQELGPFK